MRWSASGPSTAPPQGEVPLGFGSESKQRYKVPVTPDPSSANHPELERFVRGRRLTGPVGTGVYLLGEGGGQDIPSHVDEWFLLLFFPLMPMARWRVDVASSCKKSDTEIFLALQSRARIPGAAALGRIAKAAAVTGLACLPFAVGAHFGAPWASNVAGALLGRDLPPTLSLPVELVAVTLECAPVFLLMWMDGRTLRRTGPPKHPNRS
jgi:hypothetical protein